MILEHCRRERNGRIHPEENPKGYHEPGAGGRVAVLLNACYNGRYAEQEGLGKVAILSVREAKGIGEETYWNEERFGWMADRLAKGPREQEKARENESGKEDKEKQIQYENDGSDCHQAMEFMGGDCE